MNDKYSSETIMLDKVAHLVSDASKASFGKTILGHIAGAARISNFGAFYLADLAKPRPVLSVWSGRISDYWFRRNAADILGNPTMERAIVANIKAAPDTGVHVERWREWAKLGGYAAALW